MTIIYTCSSIEYDSLGGITRKRMCSSDAMSCIVLTPTVTVGNWGGWVTILLGAGEEPKSCIAALVAIIVLFGELDRIIKHHPGSTVGCFDWAGTIIPVVSIVCRSKDTDRFNVESVNIKIL